MEARTTTEPAQVPSVSGLAAQATNLELDKDFLCPICIQTMRDAFLTSCGHSFCYMCIMTHLNIKNNCPCCGLYLTSNQLYPNFLLNKVIKKAGACQLAAKSSPVEYLRSALKQGVDISLKEIESLLGLLTERKRKAEQEEAEANMEILLEFLQRSKFQKQQELNEIQNDLRWLKDDISAVEKRMTGLRTSKEIHASSARYPRLTLHAREVSQGGDRSRSEKTVFKRQGIEEDVREDELTSKRRRVLTQFEDLQDCYLQKRKSCQELSDAGDVSSHETGLEGFQAVLNAFTRYSQLSVVAEVRHPDLFQPTNIVSSIEFDRDDEFFATAGVSRRIKVFEYSTVVNESADVHYPVMEMTSRSKLSCLSWNKHIKNQIASSDYEGSVTIWDVNNAQSIMEYEEHAKRAWSVDFSRTDPTLLVSGSDDGKVKLWSTRQESSVLGIDMKANICCVKFNPSSSNFVAVLFSDLLLALLTIIYITTTFETFDHLCTLSVVTTRRCHT